ncbi:MULTISPECIES: hypothetical protein [Erysipelothrix]|uniref:Lipoprotein n=2 Tax=Erysipelothrix TaxID=1647 RepID=A0A3S8RNP9_9FIRM|nr:MULTISPECIES: hypothetical protein [Erysipelothrix]AZK44509.1 hypothetical protein EEI45_07020 [Erysipelothrix piscisicarius]MBK2401803.1 hypothetical protein [Erysipelothrix sp. strain 2 (EsS2-6-Brazil)]MBK2404057.1 hypothetical protein [Erysipelothrix sp. strain 2 (EsS2-7-Brazil)]NBA00891.1 hypothetical protein [Erysipelothrix rhusiopathiae]
MSLRKLMTALVLLLLVSGCTPAAVNYDDLVKSALSRPMPEATNHNKKYYRYYLLPDVGIKQSTQISTLYEIDRKPIMLDLDVANIVAKRYTEISENTEGKEKGDQKEDSKIQFSSLIKEEAVSYRTTGTYVDGSDKEQHFIFSIVDLEKNKAVVLENGQVDMMAIVNDANMDMIVQSMFTTMRSITVNEDLVVQDFSKKDIITYHERYEEFFEHAIPESGAISDIIDKTAPKTE